MKKFFFFALVLLLCGSIVFAGGGKQAAPTSSTPTKYHIGVCTGTVSQAEDSFRGAEELIKRYGRASEGGIIQHITYPDQFMTQMETSITQLTTLAADPLMKAIIGSEAVPGTAEAFRRIRETRPDILLLAGEPHEDPLVIQQSAHLSVSADWISRGYTVIWEAKQMGAKTFVHISFPRHMGYETLGTRRLIFEEACKDLGLRFVFLSAPDPTSDVGVAGAQQYIMEQTPQWINAYGTDACFFCTNNAHTEPLLRQLLAYGGQFAEADLPSPLMGYPGALGLDLSAEAGNFTAIAKKVEDAVVAKGGAGRFGIWSYSISFCETAGLGEFAKRVIDGKAKIDSREDLFATLADFTPGAKWNGNYYVDQATGKRSLNHLLVYQDTYLLGKGYMNTTSQTVPDKYYQIKFKQ